MLASSSLFQANEHVPRAARTCNSQYLAGKCHRNTTGTPPLCGSWRCRWQATIEHRTRSRGTRSEAAGQVPLVVGSATREART